LYISAKTGQRIDKLFLLIDQAYENANQRIGTGILNDCIREAVTAVEPPSDHGRRLKLYYATQVSAAPPTFVLFVNEAGLMHFSYQRYLENFLRKSFDFSGTPIRILIRERKEKEQ
ncbi:MAG: ribosome biogenesis GTPase Der, partial [Clostridiales bacterium]|nr:ribosome biogenesis GTPase Der [Clostridiales bacterium]